MTRPVYTSPIIFSGPMIRALLDSRKTQTRRLITSQWANIKMHFEMGERALLWARESFSPRIKPEEATDGKGRAWYQVDSEWGGEIKWKPSIHMPRWASRLTLELSDARLQRLQDISEEECWAEGIGPARRSGETFCDHPVNAYKALWESLHGQGSWDDNPSIIAFTFSVHRQSVDAVIGQQSGG